MKVTLGNIADAVLITAMCVMILILTRQLCVSMHRFGIAVATAILKRGVDPYWATIISVSLPTALFLTGCAVGSKFKPKHEKHENKLG